MYVAPSLFLNPVGYLPLSIMKLSFIGIKSHIISNIHFISKNSMCVAKIYQR